MSTYELKCLIQNRNYSRSGLITGLCLRTDNERCIYRFCVYRRISGSNAMSSRGIVDKLERRWKSIFLSPEPPTHSLTLLLVVLSPCLLPHDAYEPSMNRTEHSQRILALE